MDHRLTMCAVLPLLLTQGEQLLPAASLSADFNVAALQSLRGLPGQQTGEGNGKMLYMPR